MGWASTMRGCGADRSSWSRGRGSRFVLAGALAVLTLVASVGRADAHPLGNFTVNHYVRVEVSAGTVRLYYVLDEAEIPAFQERHAVAADRPGFLRARVATLLQHLVLTVDGRPVALHATATSLDLPKGQAGLNTLRVAAVYAGRLPPGPTVRHRLTVADGNEPDRVGWREIVITARGDATIAASDAPNRDVSNELRTYPGNLIQAPLDLRVAHATFTPGSRVVTALPVPRSAPPPSRAGGSFANLITRQHLGLAALASMLGLAFLVGAGHALLPGHGKTVMGAYLVGTKGRPIDAVFLGIIVSVMHTASVLVLGLLLFRLNRSVALERIYPALTIASGAIAMAFGAWLLLVRLRRLRRVRAFHDLQHAADHDHGHDDGHEHRHEHRHDDEHRHDHARDPVSAVVAVAAMPRAGAAGRVAELARPPLSAAPPPAAADDGLGHHHHHGPGGHTHELPEDVAPLTRRGLVLIATSGGVVPSPSAVILIVSAFVLGRAGLGLVLIGAFSVGLAVTLTGVGLGLVYGRGFIERRWPERSLQVLPVIGAVTLIALGLVLAIRGGSGL